jgi:hypothetical protein
VPIGGSPLPLLLLLDELLEELLLDDELLLLDPEDELLDEEDEEDDEDDELLELDDDDPPPVQSATSGVPQPVGPSYPAPAVHSNVGEQVPFAPLVTSLNQLVCSHANCGVDVAARPVSAKIEATSGDETLVPP